MIGDCFFGTMTTTPLSNYNRSPTETRMNDPEYNNAISGATGYTMNVPVAAEPEPQTFGKPVKSRKGSKTKPLEDIYRELIKAGYVRIIRKKGKAPVVQWLK